MPDRRPNLPDIRDLTEDPTVDRSDLVVRGLGYAVTVASFVFLAGAAVFVWQARHFSHFPDGVFAGLAVACVVVPAVSIHIAVRRVGRSIAPIIAVIVPPIMVFFVACFIALVYSVNGRNVF